MSSAFYSVVKASVKKRKDPSGESTDVSAMGEPNGTGGGEEGIKSESEKKKRKRKARKVPEDEGTGNAVASGSGSRGNENEA